MSRGWVTTRRAAGAVGALVLTAVGIASIAPGSGDGPTTSSVLQGAGAQPPGEARAPETTSDTSTSAGAGALAPAPAVPVGVAVPRLGIRSPLDPLRLQPDGALEAPTRWDVAGWYADGPRPGERGPAVIAGHVDGPDGPAVFWRLAELRTGDRIEVRRADGRHATFAVTRRLAAPKDAFPTEQVYGPTPHAELRLITCDGDFDRSTGHYRDNLVVFATQVDS